MVKTGIQYYFEYDGKEFKVGCINKEYELKNAIIDAKNIVKKRKQGFKKDLLVAKGYKKFEYDDEDIKTYYDLERHIDADYTMVSF